MTARVAGTPFVPSGADAQTRAGEGEEFGVGGSGRALGPVVWFMTMPPESVLSGLEIVLGDRCPLLRRRVSYGSSVGGPIRWSSP